MDTKQKITPCLWFDGNAKEAVDFYVAAFDDAKITETAYYPKTAEEGLADFQLDMAGKVLTVNFELSGYKFMALNADATFKLNPSISFMLNFDPSQDDQAEEHLNALWAKLIDGGEALMPLDAYPFSKRYGWVKDQFGVTWQLMLTSGDNEPRPFIVPSLMFTGDQSGKAEEAMNFYLSVFEDSKQGTLARYPDDTGPAKKGAIMYGDFMLAGQWFAAMDSGTDHTFTFSEAISLIVACKDQAEIDAYWDKLSKVPESEQCGWCKDQYGVSWQITPENMEELLKKPGAYARMMPMHKIIIDEL